MTHKDDGLGNLKEDLAKHGITYKPAPKLTKPPHYYLTGYEGSECESIEDYDMAPFKWKIKCDEAFGPSAVSDPDYIAAQDAKNKQMRDMIDGIDTAGFRKDCEHIEKGEANEQ